MLGRELSRYHARVAVVLAPAVFSRLCCLGLGRDCTIPGQWASAVVMARHALSGLCLRCYKKGGEVAKTYNKDNHCCEASKKRTYPFAG